MIEMYPGSSEYLFEGYNGIGEQDYEEQARAGFGEFGYLEQGYYDLGDDEELSEQDIYDGEERLLLDFYGDYYASGEYLREGLSREDLVADAIEYFDYNGCDLSDYFGGDYGYNYGYGYYGGYSYYDSEEYQKQLEELDSVGKKKPEHSINNPVDIKSQKGPKCSAYSSSCLLRYYGQESDPSELYDKFFKLPDGSAVPSSVGKVIGAKLHKNGKLSDVKAMIDEGKPVLVLIYYDEEPGWDNLHYVLVTGYDDENIYIADSLHRSGKRYYNRAVKTKLFKKMWNTSKSLPVKLVYGKNLYFEYNLSDKGERPKHI